MSHDEIAVLCGTLLEAGTDTTSITLQLFLQAMALNPAELHKAQHEMDQVVGPERSPAWADYEKLTHVAIIVKETCMVGSRRSLYAGVLWRPRPSHMPRRPMTRLTAW